MAAGLALERKAVTLSHSQRVVLTQMVGGQKIVQRPSGQWLVGTRRVTALTIRALASHRLIRFDEAAPWYELTPAGKEEAERIIQNGGKAYQVS